VRCGSGSLLRFAGLRRRGRQSLSIVCGSCPDAFAHGRGLAFEVLTMSGHRIFTTPFAAVYPMYVQKAERKGRTKDEVDEVICWLTGYDRAGLQRQIEARCSFEDFFAQAPAMHPNSGMITGVVCGVRVEQVEDPLMRRIRQLDKLVDELAKGRAMGKILRA
jgi:hypothetical protein